jgi:hypothetical protein
MYVSVLYNSLSLDLDNLSDDHGFDDCLGLAGRDQHPRHHDQADEGKPFFATHFSPPIVCVSHSRNRWGENRLVSQSYTHHLL